MTKDIINKELGKFYIRYIISGVLTVITIVIWFINRDLLILPVITIAISIYVCLKDIRAYLFWNEVSSHYKKNTLMSFIEKELRLQQTIGEESKQVEKNVPINATRLNTQYNVHKDAYKHRKRINKVAYLLKMKKQLELEQKN